MNKYRDPHSTPAGGGNAPICCLPTAEKTIEEEELSWQIANSVFVTGVNSRVQSVSRPNQAIGRGSSSIRGAALRRSSGRDDDAAGRRVRHSPWILHTRGRSSVEAEQLRVCRWAGGAPPGSLHLGASTLALITPKLLLYPPLLNVLCCLSSRASAVHVSSIRAKRVEVAERWTMEAGPRSRWAGGAPARLQLGLAQPSLGCWFWS